MVGISGRDTSMCKSNNHITVNNTLFDQFGSAPFLKSLTVHQNVLITLVTTQHRLLKNRNEQEVVEDQMQGNNFRKYTEEMYRIQERMF